MNSLLNETLEKCRRYAKDGAVANYIPELAKADINKFGICTISENGKINVAGDYESYFTMQSVVKPMILLTALMDRGADCVRKLVGVEATGKPFDAFNYSDQALKCEHINPMINTGAIALCTLIDGNSYAEKFSRLLELTRKMADNPTLEVDENVYLSEKATGNKNRALAYMLKAYGMIDDNIEEVLDFYFKACSIKVTAVDLAKVAFVLAHKGRQIIDEKYARYVNAVLMTCGMYDG